MKPRAFTLIEMLLATTLTGVLLAAVLSVSAALARDERRLASRADGAWSDRVFDLIRFDLLNASSVEASQDRDAPLTLSGHCGIDPEMHRPSGRLSRVVYRVRADGWLVREQRYLDDPVRPRPWSELVMSGARRIELVKHDAEPAVAQVRIELVNGKVLERSIMVR